MTDYNNDYNDFSGTPAGNDPENEEREDIFSSSEAEKAESEYESSYEWNGDPDEKSSGEYHYSYINGNNRDADHSIHPQRGYQIAGL